MKTVVIVGGGFAGVTSARLLRKRLPADWDIVLFSQENHFIFTPLLGDVVGSSINPMHVVCPIRQMARGVACRTAPLTRINLQGQSVSYLTPTGQLATQGFHHLVLACGSVVNLDIIPGMAAHGWPLKTMGDALLLRNHLITLLEKAEVETDAQARRRLLSVVVVGAGFSGVEVAGEVRDLLVASTRFYKNLKAADPRVTLLEGRERILPELPEKLSAFAHRKMSAGGIMIRTHTIAQAVTEEGIRLKDGSAIDAGTIICTIGTSAHPLVKSLNLPMAGNRLKTGPDFRVEGQVALWAVGDCAAVINAHDQKPSAPTAQVAVRQAKQLSDNLVRVIAGQPTRPFSFKPLGMLASIGNYKAVGIVFGLRVSGFIAWFLWRGIYLSKMPSLGRKIQIAFDWAWQLIFPRDLVQLSLDQTQRLGRAHFEPGQFVFHRGDAGDKFYLIESGRAGVYLDEKAAPVAELGPGDHFGEGALLRSAPRSASIKAHTRLDLLMVGQNSFGQLTNHFERLRTVLESSDQSRRHANELVHFARDHPRLNEITVQNVMASPVATLVDQLSLGDALRQAQEERKGGYPVVNGAGHLVGLCTRTDFYRALHRLLPKTTPLTEVMKRSVFTIRAGDTLTAALTIFLREPIKRLVVVADEDAARPVGMLTPFDILQGLDPGDRLLRED